MPRRVEPKISQPFGFAKYRVSTTKTIRVVVDTAAAKAGVANLNRQLAQIGQTGATSQNRLNGMGTSLNGVSASAQRAANGLRAANDNATLMNNGLTRMIGGLGRASIAIIGLTALTGGLTALATAFTGAADQASTMTARLNLAYASAASLAAANKQVHDIANQTRSSLGAVTDLYTKMATNADQLKLSQAQVGIATRTFAMSLKVAGASAGEAESSILQLGQALGSGVLQGDEFKSLAENNQLFMKMLAVSMDVPIGKLKQLGSQGEITGAQITKALTDPKMIAAIEQQFGAIPVTFGDVKVAISNSLVDIASAFKKGLGIDASLAQMLAKIQAFASSSQPFFEKLGTAFRSVFNGLAPLVTAVFGAIGPVISLAVNHMDGLVKAAQALGTAFLVFKAAGVASQFTGILGPIVALEKAMGATGTASALFSAGMKMAQGAVNGLTASLLANPITAIAVAITASIALLYQFSDVIKVGNGHVATLADVAAEVFSRIGPFFEKLGQIASSVLGAIGGFFHSAFGGAWDFIAPIFGNLEFSFAGFARFGARCIDLTVSHFMGGFAMIKAIWGALPDTMGAIVTSTANSVISGIETMVNKAIHGINKLIDMANNIPMVNVGKMGDIGMGRVEGPAMPNLAKVGAAAYMGQQSHFAENGLDSILAGADARHKAGGGTSKSSNAGAGIKPKITDGLSGDDADKKKTKAKNDLAEIAKKTNEFWQVLKEATNVAGMLPLDAERYNKELELRKALGNGELKDVIQLNDEQKKKIATEIAAQHLAANMTSLRAETLSQEQQALANSLRKNGLSGNELKIEDALTERRTKALADGLTLNDLTSTNWKTEEERLRTIMRQNIAYDDQRAKLEAINKSGQDLIANLSDARDPSRALAAQYGKDKAAIATATKPVDFSGSDSEWEQRRRDAQKQLDSEHAKNLRDANRQFYSDFTDSISSLAQTFGGKIGQALGSVQSLFSNMIDAFPKSDGLKKIFGPSSKLVQGMEKFSAGAQMGGTMADLASAVGIKGFSKTGAQVGGGIGGAAFGPIGAAVGSILGGIVGGLLHKTKHSNATFANAADGSVIVGSVTGTKSLSGATSGAAGSILDGLSKIASTVDCH